MNHLQFFYGMAMIVAPITLLLAFFAREKLRAKGEDPGMGPTLVAGLAMFAMGISMAFGLRLLLAPFL